MNFIEIVDTSATSEPLVQPENVKPAGAPFLRFEKGGTYNTEDAVVTNFKTGLVEALKKNNEGYIVTLMGPKFMDVTSVAWYSSLTASVRLDCIGASYDGNKSNSGECVPGPSVVPLPAGAVLMLTALGGLGFARRRKS